MSYALTPRTQIMQIICPPHSQSVGSGRQRISGFISLTLSPSLVLEVWTSDRGRGRRKRETESEGG